MLNLEYAEFYITNVCNLNCDRCNRFNNYAFSGHLDWQAHADLYVAWSRILTVDRIGILGGEPMLHPDFLHWVTEVANLWPNSQVMIMTNGTHLNRYPKLLDFLESWQGRIRIDISRHNSNRRDQCLSDIEDVFHQGFTRFCIHSPEQYAETGALGYVSTSVDPTLNIIDPARHSSHIWDDKSWQFVYQYNNQMIRYSDADFFDESLVRVDQSRKQLYLTPEINDPDLAAAKCLCKFSHHFLHGKLYKCGVTAVLPEFLRQFPVQAPQQKVDLLHAYEPASCTWSDHDLSEFLTGLKKGNAIPQCGLCPDQFHSREFYADSKKIKIQKIQAPH